MKNKVEAALGKTRQISRVAFLDSQIQIVSFGDKSVLFELFRRIVKNGDARSRRR